MLHKTKRAGFSTLGIAIGIYLPLSTSIPIFLGGMIAWWCDRDSGSEPQPRVLLACGLVAGAAIMDVLLAIPFSILKSPDALSLVGPGWEPIAAILGGVSIIGLWWVFQQAGAKNNE